MDNRYPVQLGFHMPAEWAPHAATIVAWPHNTQTWPRNLRDAQTEFVQLVQAIANDEPVLLLAGNRLHAEIESRLQHRGSCAHEVALLDIPTNDAWVRDYGPTFVCNGEQLLAIDWHYNAWGGKYPPYHDDQQVVRRFVEIHPSNTTRIPSKLCIEGGAIEIDDAAVVLCTRSCALNPNRNAPSEAHVQSQLQFFVGAEMVLWLSGNSVAGNAIEGDDTDGHIDQLARFVPGKRILHATSSRSDVSFEILERNRVELVSEISKRGLDYQLIELPIPAPVVAFGNRLPASYCNFYVTNQSVLVPTFGQPQDDRAIQIIAECFSDRNVIGLPSRHLSVGLGSFHCLTQQIPALGSAGR